MTLPHGFSPGRAPLAGVGFSACSCSSHWNEPPETLCTPPPSSGHSYRHPVQPAPRRASAHLPNSPVRRRHRTPTAEASAEGRHSSQEREGPLSLPSGHSQALSPACGSAAVAVSDFVILVNSPKRKKMPESYLRLSRSEHTTAVSMSIETADRQAPVPGMDPSRVTPCPPRAARPCPT